MWVIGGGVLEIKGGCVGRFVLMLMFLLFGEIIYLFCCFRFYGVDFF